MPDDPHPSFLPAHKKPSVRRKRHVCREENGGSGTERLRSVWQTADGGFVLGGPSDSGTDGNKTSPNYGGSDFWVVKLAAEAPRLRTSSETGPGLVLFPGTTNHSYALERSGNLMTWTPFATNRPSRYKVETTDPGPPPGNNFYRGIRLP